MIQKRKKTMNNPIYVFLPTYNEDKYIGQVVNSLKQSEFNLKIYVINDGSNDTSEEIVKRAGAIAVTHPLNLGQWAAMRTAFIISLREGAEVVVSLDADSQHDPKDLPKLVEPVVSGEADIVIGSRFLGDRTPEIPKYRQAGIRLFNKLVEIITKKKLTDCVSGYKAYNMGLVKEILPHLSEDQYGALEFIIAAIRKNAKILERPIRTNNNPKSNKGSIRYGYHLLRTTIKHLL